MEKIYSRKRILFFRKEKNRKTKYNHLLKSIVLLSMFFSSIFIVFLFFSYPIFVASCKTAAGSKANHIVHDEIHNVMEKYTYDDIIKIEKDDNGNVVLAKFDTVLINQITSQISTNIQEKIDNTPTINVCINLGSISGVTFFRNFGPKFDIELEAAGRIDTEIKSEFKNININQTSHRIYLDLNTNVNILTPVGVFGKDVNENVLLTEAVIVGHIPETYYNLEGIKSDNTLDVID